MPKKVSSLREFFTRAVDGLKGLMVFDQEARSSFLEALQPAVRSLVFGYLKNSGSAVSDFDLDDLFSTVNEYLLEKWIPKLKLSGLKVNTLESYFCVTVDGVILNWFNDKGPILHQDPPPEPCYFSGAWFVSEADFQEDRKFLSSRVKGMVERYLSVRRRGLEVQDVIERMIRIRVWEGYWGAESDALRSRRLG